MLSTDCHIVIKAKSANFYCLSLVKENMDISSVSLVYFDKLTDEILGYEITREISWGTEDFHGSSSSHYQVSQKSHFCKISGISDIL